MIVQTPALSESARKSQQTFRAVLDSMARPAKVNRLPVAGPRGGAWDGILSVAECLLDHEVSYWVSPGLEGGVEPELGRATRSRKAALGEARFLLARGTEAARCIAAASIGSIEYPDEGATLLVACDSLSQGPVQLRLSGPGVPGFRCLNVAGAPAGVFRALTERNRDFPLGVDLALVSTDCAVACLPRSCSIEIVTEKS